MGKLNFCGYLISRFFPSHEIRENLMHVKNMCFTVLNCMLRIHRGSPNIDQFLKSRQCYTAGNLQYKHYRSYHPDRCRYTTWENITLSYIASAESTATADQACVYWTECERHRWAGTKLMIPGTKSSFSILNSTMWCCTDNFSQRDLGLNCLKTPAAELTEANCNVRFEAAQSSCW